MTLSITHTDYPIGKPMDKAPPDYCKPQSMTLTAHNNTNATLLEGLVKLLTGNYQSHETVADRLTSIIGRCKDLMR